MTYSVTAVTLQKCIDGNSDAYEATITVNNEFTVQVSGNKEEATFHGITDQDAAYINIDSDDVEKALEECGFENNLGWLEDNATTVI